MQDKLSKILVLLCDLICDGNDAQKKGIDPTSKCVLILSQNFMQREKSTQESLGAPTTKGGGANLTDFSYNSSFPAKFWQNPASTDIQWVAGFCQDLAENYK